jgi:predicted anti-sigma-YlaC factor YlaD
MADRDRIPNPCKELEEDLVLLHYGDLAGAERHVLQDHLVSCAGCTGYLKELATLLPLTIKTDEPSQTFWHDYSRELRHKIDAVSEKQSWRQRLSGFFQPWPIPALAAAAVITLALTLTLGKGIWQSNDLPKDDAAMIEALPVAENLEFFKAMDVLDDLDLLESMGNQGDAA